MKLRSKLVRALPLAIALAIGAPLVLSPARVATAQDGEDEEPAQGGAAQKLAQLNQKGVEALTAKRYDEGLKAFHEMLAVLEKEGKGLKAEVVNEYKKLAEYNLACGYSLSGQKNEAIEHFDKSVKLGFWDWSHIEKDTDLDAVRGEEKFKSALAAGKELQKTRAKDSVAKLLSKEPLFDYPLSTRPLKSEKKVKLDDYAGKVVIVDLFTEIEGGRGGSAEAVELGKLWKEKKEKGVEVVGLFLMRGAGGGEGDDQRSQAADVIDQLGIPYPVGLCSEAQLKRAKLTLRGDFPCTLILDKGGKLRAKLTGADRNLEQVKAILEVLEAEKAPEKKDEKGEEKKDEKGGKKKKDEPI